MTKPTTEAAFEETIEAHLLTANAGYHRGDPDTYDQHLALIPGELLRYIEQTQPKTWTALRKVLNQQLEPKLLAAFDKATADTNLLTVLRNGFKFHGKLIRPVHFRPPNDLNPDELAKYHANRLLVVRQLHHDPKRPKDSIDVVLFVNGIPVVTIELKNHYTGQTVDHAREQYQSRDPDAPIFRFKRRALINFAVDPDEVYMAPRLQRESTYFLPFNKGIGTGAGNPPVEGKHRTCYLWEQIWQRDSLLDILHRFVHLEVDDEGNERMIFPRYHQLDCVRRLEDAARSYGAGTNYLVQHSAGSGKSNSIGWLAHRLSALHDAKQERVYETVIVVTDRKVLDRQLQETIYQLDRRRGIVQKIDENSAQLADALQRGVPIIITTLHKFGFIAERIGELPDRRYAIIVDEAHSSQTGEMRNNLKTLLADSKELSRRAEELGEEEDVDAGQDVLRAVLARGPLANLSFFAFTATPKYKTLQVFGRKGPDGKYEAFHTYTMRQAIEEKFILDVLRGYTTYRRYFELVKRVAEDPRLDKKQATKALARVVNQHPKDIQTKLEIIVGHFCENVRDKLGGRAKGMIVTASRLDAIRYKLAFDAYVKAHNLDLRALVAFSGDVVDPDDPATKLRPYTEPDMNTHWRTGKPIPDTALPKEFATDAYQLLIVANKYQTGFDQPLLCAMYVIKRLAGVQAVQTLSRLNRTHRGKDETFVLDFVNERDHILACFKDYYEVTSTDEEVDPQRLYELQGQLESVDVLRPEEIDAFAELFFRPQAQQVAQDGGRLNALIDPAVERFKALDENPREGLSESPRSPARAVPSREGFRDHARAFCNLYGLLAQILPFSDVELEKLYVYVRWLLRKLPRRGEKQRPVDLGNDVALHYYRMEKTGEGRLALAAGEQTSLRGPGEVGTGHAASTKEPLSNIVQRINARFATDFDVQDLVDSVGTHLLADTELQQAAQGHSEAEFDLVFKPRLQQIMMDRYEKYGAFIDELFDNDDMKAFFEAQMLRRIYAQLSGDRR